MDLHLLLVAHPVVFLSSRWMPWLRARTFRRRGRRRRGRCRGRGRGRGVTAAAAGTCSHLRTPNEIAV